MDGLSCSCLTYARLPQLEEALESYLRQEYGEKKELVILNDQPGVIYRFDHPEVRIVNLSRRESSMGAKLNLAVSLCRYAIRIPWPDDDIHLPHALRSYARALGKKDYLSFSGYWVLDKKGELSWLDEIPAGMIAARTAALATAGGYPERNCGEDKEMRERLEASGCSRAEKAFPRKEGFFIHRRGAIPHLSGFTDDRAWEEMGKTGGEIPSGEYDLHPRWEKDYSCIR